MNDIDMLGQLYSSWVGTEPAAVVPLAGGGGGRRYYRLSGCRGSVVGVCNPDEAENRTFAALSGVLAQSGVNVPEILAVSPEGESMLQTDLGDRSLFGEISGGILPYELVDKVIAGLVRMQTMDPSLWNDIVDYPPMGRRLVMWDLNYFKYEFLKPSGIAFSEERLEDDFERLTARVRGVPESLQGFMWRDCQSRNIILTGDTPYFIDYQAGRRGPGLYDAVSFAWQARAGFTPEMKEYILHRYAEEYAAARGIARGSILEYIPDFTLLRVLQTLGAYGLRGLVEHKAHFLQSIPAGIDNLRQLLATDAFAGYPELQRIAQALVADPRFTAPDADGRLHVRVFSFSYKKGYPDDFTGNGGGFMFDCRAMHNPGRYDQYKPMTGMDLPVREFLEERGEVQAFLESAWQLTDKAVARYLQRGFSSLQIGFGCTGGRHRSVYCADATARHIREAFPEAVVELLHREQPSL